MTVQTSFNSETTAADAIDTLNSMLGSISSLNGAVFGAPSTFTMTQLASPYKMHQRATNVGGLQNKGTGSIPVIVNVTTIGTPLFRIRASDGVTILKSPTPLTPFTNTGVQTLNVNYVDARLGWFYVDLSGDGSTWQNGTTLVGMGGLAPFSGQSLAVRAFGRMDSQTATNASLGVTINPNGSVYGTYSDSQRSVGAPAWALPADASNYDSTFVAEFLNRMITATGVNWGLVAANPVGGQSITTFLPGGGNNAGLRARLNEIGGFEMFIWMQGHSDVGGDTATYQNNLTTLFADVTARNGVRGSNYTRLVNDLPNITSGSYPTPAARQALHVAVAAWCNANGATYVQPRDLDLIDGIHQSQAGSITLARHFYRAGRPALGLGRGDVGPTFGTPTRSGVTITIPVSLPSGSTALVSVGNPATRFLVYPTGTTTGAVSLDATTPIVVGTSSITLKLAANPGDSTALDVYFGYPSDPNKAGAADMIYDNGVDGDGIAVGRQLMPNLTPAVVAAVAAAAPINSTAPAITPTSATVGTPNTTTTGAWTGSPTGYAYRWRYGDTLAIISGATSASYTPVSGDIGHTLQAGVIATNASGSSTETWSNATTAVATAGSTKIGADLTPSSMTYSAAPSGFGTQRSGGYASSAASGDTIPASNTWTIEGFITCDGVGSPKVAFGQSNKCWVGVAGNGQLIVNVQGPNYLAGGSNGGSGTLPNIADGIRRHVRVVSDAGTVTVRVNGTSVATATGAVSTAGGSVFNIGTFLSSASYVWTGSIDELAVWPIAYTGPVPSAPYTGNEGMTSLWHLDGNVNAAVV